MIGDRLLIRLLAVGSVSLIAATWPLWTPQTVFPQVPLVSVAGHVPSGAEWGLLVTLLIALAAQFFAKDRNIRRFACAVFSLATLSLIVIDQHRLQPWAWQFVLISFALAVADATTARSCWSWLVIGIYAWSAWSKMDQGFVIGHGRFLLDGLFKSIGQMKGIETFTEPARLVMTASIPIFEMLIAVGLCWHRTRLFALIGSGCMHVALILALGPFGHQHQPGVLIWNLFFLVQNWVLFGSPGASQPDENFNSTTCSNRTGNYFARTIVVAALFWPSLEQFGLCDHWPAWAVYAAKPERVTVFVHSDEESKLPNSLRQYLGVEPILDEWRSLRIDRWSLNTLYAPIYPQDRFQVGVALGISRLYDMNQIRVVVEGPADRWTGKRKVNQYIGIESLNQLADSYRCNAQPRMLQFSKDEKANPSE